MIAKLSLRSRRLVIEAEADDHCQSWDSTFRF
jgi:hypothetical protein